MLSTLPKLADRAFILGFFLPSLLFVLTLLALFNDGAAAATLRHLDAASGGRPPHQVMSDADLESVSKVMKYERSNTGAA